jgi:hypothetical protein
VDTACPSRSATPSLAVVGSRRLPEHLSHGPPPSPPGSGTIGPALAAAPASTALSRHKVVGCEFVAIAAAAWRQDSLLDALRAEKREY